MPPKRKTSAFTGTGRALGGRVVKAKAKPVSKAEKAAKELEEYVLRKDDFDSSDSEDALPLIKRERPVRAVREETEKKIQKEMLGTGEMEADSFQSKKEGNDAGSFAGAGRRLDDAEPTGDELA